MANEFRHSDVNTTGTLTESEYEGVGTHIFNSQATGDILYASSSTQLSRLGIGATNKILTVIGGVPTWQSTLAGLTLTSPTINGTIATTGLTLPAVTLGGTLTANSQSINGIASLRGRTDDVLHIVGAYQGVAAHTLSFYTPAAGAGYADTARLQIGGGAATVVATWSSITHTGLDITSGQALKVNGTQVVGARVVDARCDDAINSGDATTDGVIDALRDAMITHGLIAAA